MSQTPSIIALIPARAGSKRIKDKNVRLLGGKPLICWTIEAAQKAGIFSRIIVCTDSVEYGRLAEAQGVEYRPRPVSEDDEPDIDWLRNVAMELGEDDVCMILRCTSPFRTAETIQRAWRVFQESQPCDSLRAVEPVKQHPGKMWVERDGHLLPLLPWMQDDVPWHSSPTQTLPEIYMQNASLEIVWARVVRDTYTIAGTNVVAFLTRDDEGRDLNTEADWQEAERLIEKGIVCPSSN